MSSSIRPLLDKIERPIAKFLKDQGFEKRGRTFNREAEKGIIQVVNLQSGSYPIGNYVVPGIRESFYCRFAVNLGVGIEELWNASYPNSPIGSIWQDYNCTIRTRLGVLLHAMDHWWTISEEVTTTSNEIIDGLTTTAFPWFSLFDSRENIDINYTSAMAPAADLHKAVIAFFQDRNKGSELLQTYYDLPHPGHAAHKEYVYKLAESLGVKLKA